MGLRCLTVRVSDRTVRHLIRTGYLSLESSGATPAVAIGSTASGWIFRPAEWTSNLDHFVVHEVGDLRPRGRFHEAIGQLNTFNSTP